MNNQYLKIAIKNLKVRSLRSWLTILGIAIGIFLIISLLSLSEGLRESVMRQLRMMGGNLVIVVPGEDMMTGMMGGAELSDLDIRAIKRARGVERVLAMPWGMGIIRHQNEVDTTFLFGISFREGIELLREDMGWETTEGIFPRPGRREVLVGALIPYEIFPEIKVGDEIRIEGGRFTVTGVLRSLGNRQDDSAVVMDIDDFRAVTGKREGAPIAMARVAPGFEVESVIQNITASLEENRKRKIGEESMPFSVMSSDTVSAMVEGIMGIIQAIVLVFASIAIIVGGIGIMNTMFTSVKERTREIGILKAMGAKRNHITKIFLFESGIIGLIGGVGGLLLGIMFSVGVQFLISLYPQFIDFQAHISPLLIIFGLTFSFLIGCASGYFPARSAANLEPVEALRYE